MNNQLGRTALHNASTEGHIEIVRLLLDRGANFDVTNKVRHYV